MVAPPDGDGVLGGPSGHETSAALSRLYVRVLRPDQKWCTLRHRAGARIQLRHRDMDADARESATECATIGDEPFVTLSSLPRMQLALSVHSGFRVSKGVSCNVERKVRGYGLGAAPRASGLKTFLDFEPQTFRR